MSPAPGSGGRGGSRKPRRGRQGSEREAAGSSSAPLRRGPGSETQDCLTRTGNMLAGPVGASGAPVEGGLERPVPRARRTSGVGRSPAIRPRAPPPLAPTEDAAPDPSSGEGPGGEEADPYPAAQLPHGGHRTSKISCERHPAGLDGPGNEPRPAHHPARSASWKPLARQWRSFNQARWDGRRPGPPPADPDTCPSCGARVAASGRGGCLPVSGPDTS